MKRRLLLLRGTWLPLLAVLSSSRSVASTLLVYNNNDNGAGSLRQSITNNNALGGGNTVIFSNVVTGAITFPESKGAFEPWASNTDPTDVPKRHVQEITTSPFAYNI